MTVNCLAYVFNLSAMALLLGLKLTQEEELGVAEEDDDALSVSNDDDFAHFDTDVSEAVVIVGSFCIFNFTVVYLHVLDPLPCCSREQLITAARVFSKSTIIAPPSST